jgi:hypothetical protein
MLCRWADCQCYYFGSRFRKNSMFAKSNISTCSVVRPNSEMPFFSEIFSNLFSGFAVASDCAKPGGIFRSGDSQLSQPTGHTGVGWLRSHWQRKRRCQWGRDDRHVFGRPWHQCRRTFSSQSGPVHFQTRSPQISAHFSFERPSPQNSFMVQHPHKKLWKVILH